MEVTAGTEVPGQSANSAIRKFDNLLGEFRLLELVHDLGRQFVGIGK